ncbi:putative disease resistance protein [Prunus yedoensis var. nudiflora]|uniref:Putative disease resistance protein n=1 Tax=Prunus yedoensis var. nudiflora TaxID=2094558 RepID=A0A314UPT6_PRUYE|nr:putative disease resistance protein [Prunus yedoensis var. nudiflora]
MAEAVVSLVLESIRDFAIQEALFSSGVSRQVEAAQTELQLIQGFLKDSDARQGQDETVRIWVAKIRDASYDLEDVIQTYGLKVDSKKQETGLTNVFKRIACIFKEGVDVHRIGKEIENITTRISDMRSNLQKYNIKEIIRDRDSNDGESSLQLQERLRRTRSHVVERDVVGLESNVEELVMHLVKDENRHRVLSIWGMGGLGKTTLARKVYHDKKEQKQEIKDMTDDEIAKKLFLLLQEMRCLVILDDIWRIEAWNLLKDAFPNVKHREHNIAYNTQSSSSFAPE